MLHNQMVRSAARQPMGGLHAQLVQHKRRDDRVDCAHAELVQVLGAQTFGDMEQPLDVVAVWWVSGRRGVSGWLVMT